MINYLKKYKPGPGVRKFQMGGEMPAPPPGDGMAPPAQGGGGPDIEAMIVQAFQTQDPQLALETINVIAEASGLAEQASGGAPPPAEGMAPPPDMAPPGQEAPMPMGRYGMRVPKLKKVV